MRFDWRVSAGAAAAAVFLSLVTGLISGVPFATLLGRALVGAVLFAALAAAISYVVDKYLPDLKTVSADSAVGDGSGSGNLVDIVVDDPTDEAAQDLELEEAEIVDDDVDIDEPQADGDGPESEEVADEPADVTPDSDEAGELEEVSDEELAGRLPDIEGLSEGFSDGEAVVESDGDSGRSGEDPSVMARAIRTVLKREE